MYIFYVLFFDTSIKKQRLSMYLYMARPKASESQDRDPLPRRRKPAAEKKAHSDKPYMRLSLPTVSGVVATD